MFNLFMRVQPGLFAYNTDIEIEKGKILKCISPFEKTNSHLFGTQGIIKIAHISYKGFDDYALSHSYKSILQNFNQYNVYPVNIRVKSYSKGILMVFCHDEAKEIIVQDITEFIENPYQLSSHTYVEDDYWPFDNIQKENYNNSYNFFWCLDKENLLTALPLNWMAFFHVNQDCFLEAITKDYEAFISKRI